MSEWQCKRCGSTERYKSGKCAPCCRARETARYVANPVKSAVRNAAWRAANPEKQRAYFAARRAANPEKMRAQGVAWRAANPEKRRANARAWSAANPEKMRAAATGYCNRKQTAKSLSRLFSFLDEMHQESAT